MGSSTVALRGAPQNRAKVIQRSIMLAPVTAAIATDRPIPISFRTGSTGSVTGRRLMRIVAPISSSSRSGFSALNTEPRPEHGRITKRFEPESIDVIGRGRAAAKNHNTQGREQRETSTSAATLPRADYHVTTVFLVAHIPVPPLSSRPNSIDYS